MQTTLKPSERIVSTRRLSACSMGLWAMLLLAAAAPPDLFAEARYVYHERTTADPGCGGNYVTTLNPSSAQTYPLRFKVENQFFTDTARVYYTTDGSTPGGTFGSGNVGTLVVPATYTCTFGGPVVDVLSATIPAQPAGTVVKYIVSAWHSGGGVEIFGNGPGAVCACGTPTSSSALATVQQYTVGSTTTLYWDINGATAGAGGATPAGNWDTTTANWSTVFDGTVTNGLWTSGRNAVFSAGTDATGAWTVTLPSALTATSVTVEEGTVTKSGAALTTQTIVVNSGATLSYNSSGGIVASAGATLTLNGTGATFGYTAGGSGGTFLTANMGIVLNGGGTLTDAVGNPNIYSGVISGTGDLTKTGPGILSITATATYSGSTRVNNGVLRLRTGTPQIPNTDLIVTSPGGFDAATFNQTVQSVSGTGNLPTSGSGTLTIAGTASTTFSGVWSGSGRINVNKAGGAGTLTLAGVNTASGRFTVTAGTATVSPSASLCGPICDLVVDGGTLNLNNTAQIIENLSSTLATGTINLGVGHTLMASNVANSVYSGTIAGPGGILKLNNGVTQRTLTLSGPNTYDGNTIIGQGLISAGSATALGSTAGYTEVASGASALFEGATTVFTINEPFRIAGIGSGGSIGGAIFVQSGANVVLGGAITLTGDAIIGVSGAGTVALSNPNAITSLANQNLTLQGGAPSTGNGGSISGVINLGSGGLTKLQGGPWTLSGANVYSGPTTISAGTLRVANTTGSATGSGAVTVASGATLSGSGTIAGSVSVTGTIAAGASPGTLNTGSEIWNGGATDIWEINDATGTAGGDPGWDLLNITGTLTITATPASKFNVTVKTLTLANVVGAAANFNPAQDYTWVIATASGGISGFSADKFNVNTNGFTNALGGSIFLVEQSGNNIQLHVVHPATITCPGAIVQNTDPGVCTASVTFAPTTTGTTPVDVLCKVTAGALPVNTLVTSPYTFPKGATTITCTATNLYGTNACTFSVTVNDMQVPVLTRPPQVTVQCASQVPAGAATEAGFLAAGGTISDNCPGPFTVAFSDAITPGSCANRYTILRTYTVTDASGNSAITQPAINVNDTLGPVITLNGSATTNVCTGDTYMELGATATDNCEGSTTVTVGGDTVNTAVPGTYVVTYNAPADACGNAATQATRTVTVGQAPMFTTCPSGTITQTNDLGTCVGTVTWTTAVSGSPTPSLSCKVTGGALPVDTAVTSPYAFPKGTTMVTCTASNFCGLATCSFSVTVNDTEAPVFNCGQNETVSCMQGWGFTFPIITDNCDGLISGNGVPISTTTNFMCSYTFTATRIWQVTDSSANTTYCTQVVTYVDFIAPTITACPANITVECLALVPAPNTALVTATHQFDPCETNAPLVQHFSDVTNGMNPTVITRTYRAYDACSNYAQCVQTIMVPQDTNGPVITVAGSATTNVCTGDTYVELGATATDACDGSVTVVVSGDTVNTAMTGTYVVRFNASDSHANAATEVTRTVTVGAAPSFTACPSGTITTTNDLGTCNGTVTWTTAASGSPAPAIQCKVSGGALPVNTEVTSPYAFPKGTTMVTCTATNLCGSATCGFSVTVNDTEAPVFNCGQNETVSCMQGWGFTYPIITDNCDGLISGNGVPISTTTNFTCGYTFIATRIWQVTDSSANTTYCTQVVTYVDFIAPTITSCPADVSVECLALVPAPNAALVTATHQFDPCETNAPLVQHFSDVTNGVNPIVITRTYRAYDACSNAASCVQTITVQDTTPPVLTACPASFSLLATGPSGAMATYTVPTATDCTPANPVVTCNPPSGSTFPAGPTTVTCSAMDAAMNSTNCMFQITVTNTMGPLTLQQLIDVANPGDTVVAPSGHHAGVHIDKNLTLDCTAGGVVITGASPALTILAGMVSVNGGTFTTATDDPTVLLSGGSLKLRNALVEESSGFNQVAISVTGGTLDLGTAGDLGGNTVKIVMAGSLISNAAASAIPALGNTWKQDGSAITSNFTIEDEIFHALDAGGGGLVTYVANNVYVTQNSASIQRGVNAVVAGDTVNVDTGTFAESVLVDKSVTLLGARAGQNANTRFAAFIAGVNGPKADPSVESVITAAAVNPGSNVGNTIHVMADNVTIDGFVIDGNNPALTPVGAVIVGGINTDARRGIQTETAAGVFFPANNVTVRYNVIQNFAQRGVQLINGSSSSVPATSGSLITGNLVRNFGVDGIVLFFNAHADITFNTVICGDYPNVEAGIWLQDFLSQGTPIPVTIASNNITVGQDNFGGIWVNLAYLPALSINYNTVNAASGVTGASDYTYGIYLTSQRPGSAASLTGNIVGASGGEFSRGIALWNLGSATPTTVTGGTVGNSLKGVSLHDNDPNFGLAGANSVVNLSGVSISGTTSGIFVDASGSTGDTVLMQISGNTSISASTTGVSVLGANASANIHDNLASITGNGVGIDVDGGKARIQTTTLTGNTVAGIRAQNGAIVDAGNCAGTDITGLGASTGGNILIGYGFDDAAPWAVENLNTSPDVYAQNNSFGAGGPGNHIERVLYDDTDNAAKSPVHASQLVLIVTCPPSPASVQCAGGVQTAAATLPQFFALGGAASSTEATVTSGDTGPVPGPNDGTITRTYNLTDACSQSASCMQTLPVNDTTPPTVVCKNVTLNFTGPALTITPGDVFLSGTDNCGGSVTPVSVAPDTFGCPGVYTATLSASDGNGNTNTCVATITINDARPTPTVVYVDDSYAGLTNCLSVDFPYTGAGPHIIGYDAFATIQAGVNAVASGGTVNVAPGSYREDVNVNKLASVLGAGIDQSIVVGVSNGASSTVFMTAAGALIDGFTITREGNNPAEWNNNLNSAGLAIQSVGGMTVRHCKFEGNRTGIDINNSAANVVVNNVITNNRSGILLRNPFTNSVITGNAIHDNWTIGVLIIPGGLGEDGTGAIISSNSIAGNWYAQVENRSALGGLKNFSGNWLGSSVLTFANVNGGEPGYAAQIPVAFGGSAVPPGGAPSLKGTALADLDYTPWLHVGTDTSAAVGFQGDFSTVHVDDDSAQVGAIGRIQEGINLAGTTVRILSGSYTESPDATVKSITLAPGASPGQVVINGDLTLDGNDTLDFELNGTTAGTGYDQFVVNGMVTLGGATLNLTAGFAYADCASLTLIDNDGMDAVNGTFNGLADGATVTVGGQNFKLRYTGGTGNDVVLIKDTVAPAFTACPAEVNACSSSGGPVAVNFTVTATDNCAATVVCTPASGSMFAVGTTAVGCTATDLAGNTATPCAFNVKMHNTPGIPATVYVDDGYVGLPDCTPVNWPYTGTGMHYIGYDAFTNISLAITAVPSGGTVNVAAGSYAENIILAKRVSLLGAKNGVDARGRVTGVPNPAVESIITPANPASSTLELQGGGCALSVIDGLVFSGGTSLGVIRLTTGQADGLQIINNHITGFSGAAIFLDKSSTDTTVARNVLDGSNLAGSGQIVFLDGPDQFAGFELICNWIQNGSSRSGLFVDGNRNVKPSASRPPLILQNVFANQTNNVGINMGSRSFDSGVIAMNTFTNNGFDGLQGGPKDSLIISNLFVDNKRWGLALTSFGNAGAGRGATNDTITCNTFTRNGLATSGSQTNNNGAILFSATQPAGNNASHRVNFNNISGNSTGAVYTGSEIVNMENNWWGAASGPTHASNPGGTGDIVFGNTIDFMPFLPADSSFPIIACPANVALNNAPGLCSAVATFTAPVVSAPCCPGPITAACSPPSGSSFPVGTNTVLCSATNDCGKVSTCSFLVIVTDTEAPLITCPGTINTIANPGQCFATGVAPGTTTTSDNCGVASVASNAPSQFPVGTNLVTWTVTDIHGNTASCTQQVVVVDTQAPIITCPANILANANAGQCYASPVLLGSPTVTDNCGVASVASNAPSQFPVGTNLVVWTATDIHGNSSTCTQAVVVIEHVAPIIACPVDLTVQCDVPLTPANTGSATATDNCDPTPALTYLDTLAVNVSSNNLDGWAIFISGVPLTASGQLVNGPATPPAGTGSFRASVGNNGENNVEIRSSGYSGVLLNNVTELNYRTYRTVDGTGLNKATYLVLNIDSDGNGFGDDVIIFEPEYQNGGNPTLPSQGPTLTGVWQSWNALTGGWASQNHPNLMSSGTNVQSLATYIAAFPNARIVNSPSGGGIRLGAGGGSGLWDNFDGNADRAVIGTNGVSTAYNFDRIAPAGCNFIVTRTWKTTDGSGNASYCSQLISIQDTVAPVITCPADITVANAPGACGATVSYTTTSTDNCSSNITLVCTPASGSSFPAGTNSVTCRADDGCGNTNTCSFKVIVNDTERPSLVSCAPAQTLIVDSNCVAALPNLTGNVMVTDNCPTSITQSPAAGTLLPIGTHPVTFTITDTSGNTTNCVALITVREADAPTILFCVPPQLILLTNACTTPLPDYTGLVSATNHCGGVTITQNPPPGTILGVGVTNIVFTVVNSSGNSTTCGTTVTVRETIAPVMACPMNLIVECAAPAGTAVTFTTPATDDCDTHLTVVCNPSSGSTFPPGVTTVNCLVADASGNSNSCSFTVSIVDRTAPVLCAAPPVVSSYGTLDNFTGPEASSPSANLLLRVIGLDLRGFDTNLVDAWFVHTITNVPLFAAEATLRIKMRAVAGETTNDNITLGFAGSGGVLLPPQWSRRLGQVGTDPGLLGSPWTPGLTNEFVLNLGALPNFGGAPSDFLAALRSYGRLDILVQDDTDVDSIVFEVKVCQCEANILVNATPGLCGTNVTYPAPAFTDACDASLAILCVPPSGSFFAVGATEVACAAIDDSGNSNRCSFTITVRDTEAPSITCPANLTVDAAGVACSRTVTYMVTASDNCGAANVTCVPSSGSTFPAGTNTVLCTASDANGNTNSCSFTVTVRPNADLAVAVASSPNPVVVGNELLYTVTISNQGPCLATGITLSNLLSPGQMLVRVTNGTGSAGMACPAQGPVAWWRAEGNASDSAGANHGTLNGGVSFVPGEVGQAFQFDGVNDYVSVPDAPALRPASFTIEGWVRIQDPNGVHVVVSKPKGAVSADSYSIWIASGVLYAAVSDNAGSGQFLTYPELPTSSLFAFTDIVNLQSLANKLKNPAPADGVSQFISNQLSAATLTLLAAYVGGPDAALQRRLVGDLNNIIESGAIYTPARFAGVTLSAEAQYVLGRNPVGPDLVRLNRLLIRDAYPAEIAMILFPQLNQRYHVAYSFDNVTKVQALYINGALVDMSVVAKTVAYDGHSLLIGADDDNGTPASFFQGDIDELTLYSRALSGTEIESIHRVDGGGKCPTPGIYAIGNLAGGASHTVTLVAVPTNCVTVSATATVAATSTDLNAANNTASASSTVQDISNSQLLLTIVKVSPNSELLEICWPTICGPYELQATGDLTLPIMWTTVAAPVQVIGNKNCTIVQPSASMRYFRLRRP